MNQASLRHQIYNPDKRGTEKGILKSNKKSGRHVTSSSKEEKKNYFNTGPAIWESDLGRREGWRSANGIGGITFKETSAYRGGNKVCQIS